VPRAKLDELEGFHTTSHVASLFGLSTYLVKARIEDGTLPTPTKVTAGGVLLFDEAWLDRAREVLAAAEPRRRRRRAGASPQVPSPESVLGHAIGEAGWLPGWDEVVRYFETLAAASDRIDLEILGTSTDGRPYLVVAVSDPGNLRPEARERNRVLLGRLWDARAESPEAIVEARRDARTVGIILATQHANEIGGMLMTMQLAYDLATTTDADTLELLANTVALLIPSHNPDGIDMIAQWYRRWLGTPHEGVEMPWLYHPFVGHDNNRDWFMLTQAETRLYVDLHNREHPQAVFDMHQMGRFGPRFMVPPFIDPLDPNQDPLIQQGFASLGSHIAQRLTAAGKAGVVTNAIFDNYSPSLAYGNYHGSVDLLSEAASVRLATPVTLTEDDLNDDYGVDPRKRAWNQPLPWKGGAWTLADIVSYDLIAARAFLDHLGRNRGQWLDDYAGITRRASTPGDGPHAFVIPTDQRDPRATAELLDILQRGLVEVREADQPIVADGVTYPAGTRVIRLDQPAGSFARTLLEVQVYPDLRKWPDGPIQEPYDISGHTLPLQMGVRSIQIDRPLPDDANLRLLDRPIGPAGGVVAEEVDDATGWHVPGRSSGAMALIQAMHRREVPVFRLRSGGEGNDLCAGDVVVPIEAISREDMDAIARDAVCEARQVALPAGADVWRQRPVRLGVFQPWTASIDEGWARWVWQAYGVPYTTWHLPEIRQGGLRDRFDVILVPEMSADEFVKGRPDKTREKDPYPPEYLGGLGDVGKDALRRFVSAGGQLVAIDRPSAALIDIFALPVELPLRDAGKDRFACPGSILRVVIDATHPLGLGLARETAVLFKDSLVFSGGEPGITVVGRYPRANPLLSGWLHGPAEIEGKAALVDVAYGNGSIVLIGFRPYFRAQARGTYTVLFNAINRAGLEEATFG